MIGPYPDHFGRHTKLPIDNCALVLSHKQRNPLKAHAGF